MEVPVTVDETGFHVQTVGNMPDHLAMLIHTAASSEELAVRGCIRGDRRLVYYAVLGDPLTGAVLSMEEIRQMVDEMFSANEIYLPQFTGMIE